MHSLQSAPPHFNTASMGRNNLGIALSTSILSIQITLHYSLHHFSSFHSILSLSSKFIFCHASVKKTFSPPLSHGAGKIRKDMCQQHTPTACMTVYLNNIHDTDPFLNLRPSSNGAVYHPNLVLPPTCGENVNTQRSVAAGPSEVSAVETERTERDTRGGEECQLSHITGSLSAK